MPLAPFVVRFEPFAGDMVKRTGSGRGGAGRGEKLQRPSVTAAALATAAVIHGSLEEGGRLAVCAGFAVPLCEGGASSNSQTSPISRNRFLGSFSRHFFSSLRI